MGNHHYQHAHAHPSKFHFNLEGFRDHADGDHGLAEVTIEDSGFLLPRNAQSGDGSGSSNGGSSSSSSSSSSETSAGCNPALATCSTDGNSGTTVPIVLGVVIPVTFIVVAFLVIMRIKKKRTRAEDAADKHASLDFGLGEVSRAERERRKRGGKKNKKGEPEMMDLSAEKQFRKDRGLSLDMGSIGSPYVLPEQLTNSRPSFHSMSRTTPDSEDPYRPVALLRSESKDGSRPGSRNGSGSPSIWTSASDRTRYGARSNLIEHAQEPSNAKQLYAPGETPLLGSSPLASPVFSPGFPDSAQTLPRKPVGQASESNTLSPLDPRNPPPVELSAETLHAPALNPSNASQGFNFDLPAAQQSPIPTFQFTDDSSDVPPNPLDPSVPVAPPRSSSRPSNSEQAKHESSPDFDEDYVTYADVLGIVQNESTDTLEQPGLGYGLGVQGVNTGNNRLSASIRPLPPDDPNDVDPEDRANRIRSFYREYFDEKRGTMAGQEGGMDYYEDYNQEHLNGATVWDAETGQFVLSGPDRPYAHPVTRRAMTPPPRAPPRFRNGSSGTGRMYGSGQYAPGSRPRVHSSASGGVRGRKPAKKLPPPQPLSNLPTPHLLRDDSAIFNASDFAPPSTYRDRAAGRSESPMMDKRPYSPSVKAFTPLQSSFADLRAMPSPHDLRKSGTFTGLDFAPPPRIHHDTMSDAASMRSGRSNSSKMTLHNIRAGAYRVSRLPNEMVGTKNDFAAALRPTWDQRGPARGS